MYSPLAISHVVLTFKSRTRDKSRCFKSRTRDKSRCFKLCTVHDKSRAVGSRNCSRLTASTLYRLNNYCKSCIESAARVHLRFFGAGFHNRPAYNQDRLRCMPVPVIAYTPQSMQAGILYPHVPEMTSRTTHTIKYNAVPFTNHGYYLGRLLTGRAVARVRLLFKVGFYTRLYGMHAWTGTWS